MKYLLDTHAFLWWIENSNKLSDTAIEVIRNPNNVIYVSVVSAWEIAIKSKLKKISLVESPEKFIPKHIHENDFDILNIELSHVLKTYSIPSFHEDPFDRLLISQAITQNLSLVTCDQKIKRYPVKVVW